MKTKTITFFLGFICGLILVIFIVYDRGKYYILDKDYKIHNGGLLKKGTLIRYRTGMSEGFDNYILYLNIEGGDSRGLLKDTTLNFTIVPYWLSEKKDTNSLK